MNTVRQPAVAGQFYPSDPKKLKDDIEVMLSAAMPPECPPNIYGLISPHAGYIYSGSTAAYGYKLLKGKNIKTVVILAPSHQDYFRGICIYDGDAYSTPLGTIPINKTMVDELTAQSKIIFKGSSGHNEEHAVEVQLPFLQIALQEFQLIPVVIGDQKSTFVFELAIKLANVVDDRTIVIASSDLSHFHSKSKAYELDSIVEKRIKDFECEKLQEDLEKERCEACGGGAIVAMMKSAELLNKKKSIILARSDSGDVSGDYSKVVGYLSAAVY
jgi:AmmeMemoRadiSam system protein B